MKTVRLRIRGRVQGVWFRESMRIEAERFGVAGWVRNTPDGAVEAVVQGSDAAVASMLAWVHTGPPAARVDDVEISETEGSYSGFMKRSD